MKEHQSKGNDKHPQHIRQREAGEEKRSTRRRLSDFKFEKVNVEPSQLSKKAGRHNIEALNLFQTDHK